MGLSENPTLEQIIDEIDRLNRLIIDRGGSRTITPSTSNQVLAKGNYKGDVTVAGDDDLIANNIRSGKNIFNVIGTLIEGKRWARGSVTIKNYNDSFEINGLTFKPSTVIVCGSDTSLYYLGFGTTIANYNIASGAWAQYLTSGGLIRVSRSGSAFFKPSDNGFYYSSGELYYNDYYYWFAYE